MNNIKQFVKLELSGWTKGEIIGFTIAVCFILSNALILHDSSVAVTSAICGILYTIIAGKGKISCYVFGAIGTLCYSYLSIKNGLFGQVLLNMGYYFPMYFVGFFAWKNNLKKTTNEIVKTKLSLKESLLIMQVSLFVCFVAIAVLKVLKDGSPMIDGITTTLSIVGMYLTVKRAIEQWIVWSIVNGLCVYMWLNFALAGQKVYSTVIMWTVYFILGIYFYIKWEKEVK